MTLTETQWAFWRAVRDPPQTAASLAPCFRGDARLGAIERMSIYRRAYWARQIEALRDEFRRLADRVGERDFVDLAHEYLMAHPSPDPRIECVGRQLAPFLRAHHAIGRRSLADLATFEWAEVEALLAEDPSEITTAFDVPADVFPACTFALVPALRILAFATDPVAAPGGGLGPTMFAVWRRGFAVQHRRLDSDEHRAATAAIAGQPVAAVCESFGRGAEAAERASHVFWSWLRGGWISRIVPPFETSPT